MRQFLADPDRMGKITAITMQMHRNTPGNKPQWSRPALLTPDLTAQNVAWEDFLGESQPRPFDPHRFVHWRYFWETSGGNVFESMSQQLSFWYKALDLHIPRTAAMEGGVYLWKDGREVPDTMSVTLQQPEEILISWVSGAGNNQLGIGEDVLGTHGSHFARQPGALHSAENQPPHGHGDGRPHRPYSAGPHAEFLRLHPLRQGAQLSFRSRLPRLGGVPHGGGQLPRRPRAEMGCGPGRDRLGTADPHGFRTHWGRGRTLRKTLRAFTKSVFEATCGEFLHDFSDSLHLFWPG